MNKMIAVKTSELTGPALDWAVAVAVGYEAEVKRNEAGIYIWLDNPDWIAFKPSTNWTQGGPLLDECNMAVIPEGTVLAGPCNGSYPSGAIDFTGAIESGDTYLIAICRAVVASKLGDVIEVPAELVEGASHD